MLYPFNFQIDTGDLDNFLLKDVNTYPVFNQEIQLGGATAAVTLAPGTLAVQNIEPTLSVVRSRVIKVNGGFYANSFINIDNYVVVDPLAPYDYDAFSTEFTNTAGSVSVTILKYTLNDDLYKTVHTRKKHAPVVFITHRKTEGDTILPIDQGNYPDSSEWAFTNSDGGWYVVDVYMVKQWVNSSNAFQEPYLIGEVVWDRQGSTDTFYVSLVTNNVALLNDAVSWQAVGPTPTQVALKAHFEGSKNEDSIYYYTGNAFILSKLENMISQLNIEMGCGCDDKCSISTQLKLAMYLEQIKSLVIRQNYSKAQETYEIAVQLAQNAL